MKPLTELIKAKELDWVNKNITDSFFEEPKEIGTDFKLFDFDGPMTSEEVITAMEKTGYRPANAWELLTWDGWNDKDVVAALGSVGEVGGGRSVPFLDRRGSERGLGLFWWGGGWFSLCRFLAVRNSDSGHRKFSVETSDTSNIESRIKSLENDMEKIKKFLIFI